MAAHKKASSAATVTAPAVAVVPTEALASTLPAGDAAATPQAVVITDDGTPGAHPLAGLIEAELKAVEPVENTEPPAWPEPTYPVEVTLSNNGGFAIAEPVSGAYLQAGGMQTVWLHDAAHASRVFDNLRELAQRHHLAGALLVNGVPIETD